MVFTEPTSILVTENARSDNAATMIEHILKVDLGHVFGQTAYV